MKLICDLIDYLNQRNKEYDEGNPTITDQEYDKVYFELKKLEDAYHIYYSDSPTQSIQYQVVNELKKVTHNHDMLSLDKTKDLQEVESFLGNKAYIAMAKMDGLTCSLRYLDKKLVSAETRGNGQVGEDILHNALVVSNIPKEIPYKEELVIDGEIICRKNDFEEFADEYKNPRNFASGSIRLLDSQECAKRKLSFIAWEVISGLDDIPYLSAKLNEIASYGFTTVPWITEPEGSHRFTFDEVNGSLVEQAKELFYPIDGLVFKFNDCRFGKTLGQTGHHARNALAYKFYDESYETKLLGIEYQVGRTGSLCPVARFEPIDIDGSTVEKCSLFNETILESKLKNPWIGQPIWVSKRNQIIPYIESADLKSKPESDSLYISSIARCPICGGQLIIKCDNDSEVLYCNNPECEGKYANQVEHFCGKSGLDIKGISKNTIEKLMSWGWLDSFTDLFRLKDHRAEWIRKPGFGIKSVDKILDAIEASRECELNQFIAALGIPLIGTTAAKDLAKHFGTWENFIEAVDNDYKFWQLPNFGNEMHRAILSYNYDEACQIYQDYLTIKPVSVSTGSDSLAGLNFVITGKVGLVAKNRDEFKSKIESAGGKVVGSVSKNTSYLINNDAESTTSKNVKAKELNIPILTEEKFIELFGALD